MRDYIFEKYYGKMLHRKLLRVLFCIKLLHNHTPKCSDKRNHLLLSAYAVTVCMLPLTAY